MGFKLTGEAAEDLIQIYAVGITLFGEEQAANYHSGLYRTFELLGENPELARQREEISPPVRIHPFGSHVIVYIVDDDGDALIVRVRHGRENWLDDPV